MKSVESKKPVVLPECFTEGKDKRMKTINRMSAVNEIVRQYGRYPVTLRFMPEDRPETEQNITELLMQAYAERKAAL